MKIINFSHSPDLFDCSPTIQVAKQVCTYNYDWTPVYTQKYPCNIFGATCYSDGIALISLLDEWIIIQLLQITMNENNEIIIMNTCNKQIRPLKQVIGYFIKVEILLKQKNSNFMLKKLVSIFSFFFCIVFMERLVQRSTCKRAFSA